MKKEKKMNGTAIPGHYEKPDFEVDAVYSVQKKLYKQNGIWKRIKKTKCDKAFVLYDYLSASLSEGNNAENIAELTTITRELEFLEHGAHVIFPESNALINALSNSKYHNMAAKMLEPPFETFLIVFPKGNKFKHLLVTITPNKTGYVRRCFKSLFNKFEPLNNVPEAKYLDKRVLGTFEKIYNNDTTPIPNEEWSMVLSGSVANTDNKYIRYELTADGLNTFLKTGVLPDQDNDSLVQEASSHLPELIYIVVGLCLYIQARPDKIVKVDGTIDFDRVKHRKIDAIHVGQPKALTAEDVRSKTSTHWRSSHFRCLANPRYKRDENGNIKMVLVKGCWVGVDADLNLLKE